MKRVLHSVAIFVLLVIVLPAMMGPGLQQKKGVTSDEDAYQKIRLQFFDLYKQKKYKEGIRLLEKNVKRFPQKIQTMAWNLAISYGQVKKYKKGIKILKKALAKGYWYNIWAFEGGFFKDYRKQKGFQQVVKINLALKDKAQLQAKPQMEVELPVGYSKEKKYPLFIAFHGGGENLEQFKPHWHSPLLKKEFVVAYLQSSQMASMTGFHWQDAAVTSREVAEAYQKIVNKYAINTEEVIVGGFSSGGYASLILTFSTSIPVKGFVVLCPPMPEELKDEAIEAARQRGVRGTIITTARDKRLPQQFVVFANVGHWYPKNLDQKIDQAILHLRNR